MPRLCTICSHPECPAMDQALQGGERNAVVALRFAVSPYALARHAKHARPAPVMPSLPDLKAAALVDAAQRIHTAAVQLQRQTVELRSLHDPDLLWRLHDVATLLAQVTGLLGEVTAAMAALPRQPQATAPRHDMSRPLGHARSSPTTSSRNAPAADNSDTSYT